MNTQSVFFLSVEFGIILGLITIIIVSKIYFYIKQYNKKNINLNSLDEELTKLTPKKTPFDF